jgi:hypothetical protein
MFADEEAQIRGLVQDFMLPVEETGGLPPRLAENLDYGDVEAPSLLLDAGRYGVPVLCAAQLHHLQKLACPDHQRVGIAWSA